MLPRWHIQVHLSNSMCLVTKGLEDFSPHLLWNVYKYTAIMENNISWSCVDHSLGKGAQMKNFSKHSVLMELRALLPELVTRYKVQGLELFGSVIREEQHEKSDIDLLVEFGEDADMFDLTGLGLFLEEKLNRKVDVVPKRALRAELQSAVLAEAIVV